MIRIFNPSRLTRQAFFKDLINYLDQQDDVILRQIKAQFPEVPVDKLMEEYVSSFEKISAIPSTCPSWSQLIGLNWIKRSLSERTVQFIKN